MRKRKVHNLVRVHDTTKEIPAVSSGIIKEGMTIEDISRLKGVKT
jgi:hypothetical protein